MDRTTFYLLLPNLQFPSYLNLIVVNQTEMAWCALPFGDETFGIAVFILFIVPKTKTKEEKKKRTRKMTNETIKKKKNVT
ncbi:hypothetical protein VP01_5356g3 [Puccinia sorghi]|uniref:Uncharacterized protein n=1 Tax=Puccinia sorghi TaxID=27349 RepID=A0A0L6UM26_9BASI|nr:hypothetical protein VP01_5356g3 [Puccinia sorghi]